MPHYYETDGTSSELTQAFEKLSPPLRAATIVLLAATWMIANKKKESFFNGFPFSFL